MTFETGNRDEIETKPTHDVVWHLNYIKNLRDPKNYSDELPDREIKDGDPDHFKYKAVAAYIGMVRLALQRMRSQYPIENNEVVKEINDFLEYKFNAGDGERTSPAEIDYINATLDTVIAELEKKVAEQSNYKVAV